MADQETIEDLVPEIDREFLAERYKFSAYRCGADVHVVVHDFALGPAYQPQSAELLIILPAGYPNANLDMFRTQPDVKLMSGNWPDRADVHETHNGRTWQRWSRHFRQPWRQGVDNLRTFITTVRRELARGV